MLVPKPGQDEMAEFGSPCQNIGVDPRRKGFCLIQVAERPIFLLEALAETRVV
jgi:hypothetical protein